MSTTRRDWRPTNKWWAAQCTGMATLAVAWVNAGGWTKPLTIAVIGFVSQATAAYLVSNADSSPSSVGSSATEPTSESTTTSVGVRATVA